MRQRHYRKTVHIIGKGTVSQLRKYIAKLNYIGLLTALVFFCFSVLPSLLPRPWLYQGLISGISVAIGYGLGTLTSIIIRWMTEKELPRHIKQRCWAGLIIVGPIVTITFLILGHVWQTDVHRLVGIKSPEGAYILQILLTALFTAYILIGAARLISRLNKMVVNKLDTRLPRRVSVALGGLAVTLLLWWILSGLFYDFFVTQSNRIYEARNNSTPMNVQQPKSPNRSGSSESLIPWNTIGFQGQAFIGSGASQKQITEFSGSEAKDPVRIYAGLNSAGSAAARAELAVKELKRTKAFERKVLILATTTGTGWLEPQSVDSIEYMYNGDSAIVTQQYSYLPSWISFLVDKQNARDAGRALFDAVFAEWSQLPEASRPKLITYGLSLGSFGGQAAFSGVNDLRLSVDGALFIGTPSDTELWSNVTTHRDKNTPMWLPTYKEGRAVRFAATKDGITNDQQSWQSPRLLYLQHASDPVVWFSFDLLFDKPDWLNEKRGYDVSPTMRWYPFVTFFQVGIDQFFGTSVPNGHGHNYPNTIVEAWSAVAPPDNWDKDKSDKLQAIIDQYSNE